MMVEALPTVSGAIQSGKLKPLAVASTRRLPDLPDVPTVAEAVPELAGFEARGWFVLTALTGTPDEVMQRGNQTLQAVLADPEVRQKLAVTGTYARPMSPSDTAQFIRAEQERLEQTSTTLARLATDLEALRTRVNAPAA